MRDHIVQWFNAWKNDIERIIASLTLCPSEAIDRTFLTCVDSWHQWKSYWKRQIKNDHHSNVQLYIIHAPDTQNDKMHSTLQNEPFTANFIGISVFMYGIPIYTIWILNVTDGCCDDGWQMITLYSSDTYRIATSCLGTLSVPTLSHITDCYLHLKLREAWSFGIVTTGVS